MKNKMIGLLAIAAVGSTCLLYAKTTIFSTHLVTAAANPQTALEEAQRLFTNKWDKVVITLDRDFNTQKETYKVEGFRRESSMTQ